MKKKIIFTVAVIAVCALAAAGIWYSKSSSQAQAGSKTITLAVNSGSFHDTKVIKTECAFLGDALREAALITGKKQTQGYFVTAVCGIEADSGNGYYWMLYQDGNMLSTGVDTTPLADGDAFEFRCEQFSY